MEQPKLSENVTAPHIFTQREKSERGRVVLYGLLILIGTLVIGLLAGIIDNALRPEDKNAFVENSKDIFLVVASSAPWAALFFVLCAGWIYLINKLFVRWNKALSHSEQDENYGKGIIYEIVHDNNAAAVLLLLMPLMLVVLLLIYIAIINHA
jgi:hypothetical protein